MNSVESVKVCIICEKGADEVPLLTFEYLGSVFGICPQHLPVLIHEPGRLRERLMNAASLPAADPCHGE